ncbi:hypothetical protein [Psychrilyobacter atlanticus]|uniref:hypothetical protein n=1 Tax=Psychrilyobacter atlanticus TaxID=271091 RepID=UPI00041B037F|nr:hypothetical protein [Psychrilyobacter atlanticus]
MKKSKLVFILLLGLILMGCSNAEERINNKAISEIDRGNYIKASYLLNDAIKINPNYLDGMVNYRNVYPRALDQAVEKIGEYQKVSDYKLEAYAYEDLLKLKNNYYYADDLVHQKLGLSLEIPTIEELYKLKSTMGEIYYSAGNELEERKLNRGEKREKYFLYERGVELSPKYKDIVDRREKAYKEALVKAMMEFSKNTPSLYRNNLESQVKGNIAKGKKRDLIRITSLDQKKFRDAWENNKVDHMINTGIKINLNYITSTPESIKKSITPLTWSEQYVANTKNGPVVKNIKKTYFKHDFYKSAGVKVSFTYTMKDISTGEIIGSGTFDGVGEDSYRWSTFSGNLPKSQGRGTYVRKLKSKKELTEMALSDAVSKMSQDISDKI